MHMDQQEHEELEGVSQMKIRADSLVVKLAYLFDMCKPYPSGRTTICPLFWRTVLLTPLKLAAIAGVFALVCWSLYQAWLVKWELGTLILILLSVIASVFGAQKAVRTDLGQDTLNVVGGGLVAIKKQICPIVEFK